jgi:hypothetical protein
MRNKGDSRDLRLVFPLGPRVGIRKAYIQAC